MKLVVISNRVPVPDGASAGGLTVALRDALSDAGGVWFGWNGSPPAERNGTPTIVHHKGIDFATVPLDQDDLEGYYGGYANSVLWPLFHNRPDLVDHRRDFRSAYWSVNEYLADAAAPLIDPADTVWVHDYHLIPLGGALRERGFSGRMGFFLHTPFPPFDLMRTLPDAGELLTRFFAYDLVGFQTALDARHFGDVLRRQLGATVDAGAGVATLDGKRLRFGAFPIGIDPEPIARIARESRAGPEGRRLEEELGGRSLMIGADRLDYSKGLVKRLRGFDRFLERYGDEVVNRMLYLQVAAPSRSRLPAYQGIMRQLEREAGRINGRHNRPDWTPLRFVERAVPRDTLLGYFSLARVGLVTSIRDGMNLVAKEFLASQPPDDPGVLVLSSLTGAAGELSEAAVMVNPYDADGVAEGIREALSMPRAERRRRWEAGMERLRENTVRIWRDRFLEVMEEARTAHGTAPPPAPLGKARKTRPGRRKDGPRPPKPSAA